MKAIRIENVIKFTFRASLAPQRHSRFSPSAEHENLRIISAIKPIEYSRSVLSNLIYVFQLELSSICNRSDALSVHCYSHLFKLFATDSTGAQNATELQIARAALIIKPKGCQRVKRGRGDGKWGRVGSVVGEEHKRKSVALSYSTVYRLAAYLFMLCERFLSVFLFSHTYSKHFVHERNRKN